MTDIEQEARDLLNEVWAARLSVSPWSICDQRHRHNVVEAVCRALEQRNAVQKELDDFRREVSDAMRAIQYHVNLCTIRSVHTISNKFGEVTFTDFILPAPIDPKVAALREWLKSRGISDPNEDVLADDFARLEAILAEHGISAGVKER